MELIEIYEKLLSIHGKQNWWPLNNNFQPKNWEICVGALLTQNTNWKNVEKALENLNNSNLLTSRKIASVKIELLENALKPSGFYRQKAKRLKILASFVDSKNNFYENATRQELLSLKGIGNETADAILLYACNKPYFVIDAYTKRIFTRMGIINTENYEEIRKFFENNLPKNISLYQEFHALIIEHAKKYCKTKPQCDQCPLRKDCKKNIK